MIPDTHIHTTNTRDTSASVSLYREIQGEIPTRRECEHFLCVTEKDIGSYCNPFHCRDRFHTPRQFGAKTSGINSIFIHIKITQSKWKLFYALSAHTTSNDFPNVRKRKLNGPKSVKTKIFSIRIVANRSRTLSIIKQWNTRTTTQGIHGNSKNALADEYIKVFWLPTRYNKIFVSGIESMVCWQSPLTSENHILFMIYVPLFHWCYRFQRSTTYT